MKVFILIGAITLYLFVMKSLVNVSKYILTFPKLAYKRTTLAIAFVIHGVWFFTLIHLVLNYVR